MGIWEADKHVYTYFIGYTKAFHTVKHKSLVELLQPHDINNVHAIVNNPVFQSSNKILIYLFAAVKCDNDISDWMCIKQGVSHGCVASHHLFAWYTEIL